MDETTEDELNQKRNMLYYNQLILNEKRAEYLHRKKEKDTKKQKSFILQKIESKNYLFISEKLKVVIYIFFLIGVPYMVGVCFLFLFVANANWDNFQLLNLNEFFTLWLIGSEIIVICLLVWFAFLYMRNSIKYKNKS